MGHDSFSTSTPGDDNVTTVDASRTDLEFAGETLLEAPPCPSCAHPPTGQDLIRAEMDGAFFRADFLCQACDHDHPVWYEN